MDSTSGSNDQSRAAQAPAISTLLISEKFIMTTVIMNAILIFLDRFPPIHEAYGTQIGAVGWSISLLFTVEIAIKIHRAGFLSFIRDRENCFDFIVVIASSYFILMPFISEISAAEVFLLRLARLMKVIRLLRFTPNRNQIHSGIVRAAKASGAVFSYLSVMVFIYALIGNMFFADSLPQHFGDPLKSLYSVFSVFMIEGWNTIPDQAVAAGMENASWIRAFFIIVLITGGFLGVSLANAVFVDEMVMDNNNQLQKQLDEVQALNERQAAALDKMLAEMAEIKKLL